MIDSKTKERLDEIEKVLRSDRWCTESDTWVIAVVAAVLVVIGAVVFAVLCRDWICARIVINALRQGAEQISAGK